MKILPPKCHRKMPYTTSERYVRRKAAEYKYFTNNSDRIHARSKEWYEKNKGQANMNNRKNGYLNRHGVTPEEAELMLRDQGGKCLICKELISIGGSDGANVDHCHTTNEVRGILCHKCNKGLGCFDDNITKLLSAINYLRKKKFILLVSPFEKAG